MVVNVTGAVRDLAIQTIQRIDKIRVVNNPVEASRVKDKVITASQIGTI